MCKFDFRRFMYHIRIGEYKECYTLLTSSVVNDDDMYKINQFAGLIYYYYQDTYRLDKLCQWIENYQSCNEFQKRTIMILIDELEKLKQGKNVEKEAKFKMENINVVKQVGNGCLPASIAIIMQYYSKEIVSYRQVVKEMRTEIRGEGTSLYDGLSYMYRKGYQVYPFTGDDDIVKQLLQLGYPIIVVQNSWLSQDAEDHARVLIGFDDSKEIFYTNDPKLGAIFLPYNFFKELMSESIDSVYLLFLPHDECLPLDLIDFFENNCEYYNLLGVLYDEENEVEKSETMFIKGLTIDDNHGDMLNNYAVLLLRRKSKLSKAYNLIKKAIQLAPDVPEYLESLDEILNQLDIGKG